MRLMKNERTFLLTLSGIAQKLLGSKTTGGNGGDGIRTRRSAADVAKMKKKIRAARKKRVPVAQIAKELGVTTSYIYQLDK
jgi:hypothetical protein